MKLYGRTYSREEVRQYFGDVSQFAGIRRVTLAEGRAKGMDAYEVRTGSGLCFTVLPDRCMDIGMTEHNGRPIAFQSKSGSTAPSYYSAEGEEWLRSFGGGLLTTCGLTNVGPPEQDGENKLGLHGRISNTPAESVCSRMFWEGDDLLLEVEGVMKEAVLYGENLVMHRKIQTTVGKDIIRITDIISNEGFQESPIMLLYHLNIGHPLLDAGIVFTAPISSTIPREPTSIENQNEWSSFEAPSVEAAPCVYFHKMMPDEKGIVTVAVIHKKMKVGLYLKYQFSSLPFFTEWKNMQCQDYVLGLEPGNCRPIGRSAARHEKELQHLKPGENVTIEMEIGVLTSWEGITEFLADMGEKAPQHRRRKKESL